MCHVYCTMKSCTSQEIKKKLHENVKMVASTKNIPLVNKDDLIEYLSIHVALYIIQTSIVSYVVKPVTNLHYCIEMKMTWIDSASQTSFCPCEYFYHI